MIMNIKKSFSNTIISSVLRKGRGVGMAASCILLLGAAWGCSSEDEEQADNANPTLTYSAFSLAQEPAWCVDWAAQDPTPDWQEPASYDYECSMNLLVTLEDLLVPSSTDDDQLAIFIDGTCRGVSKRNVYDDGSIVFLIRANGTSEEVDKPMEMRYYSGGAHQLFVSTGVPPFMPNNIISEEAFTLFFDPVVSSTKYPYFTQLHVTLPDALPFDRSDDDKLAVFVGNECRCVMIYGGENFSGWTGDVMLRQEGEQAYMLYYSATNGGIYTFSDSFAITEKMQSVNLRF